MLFLKVLALLVVFRYEFQVWGFFHDVGASLLGVGVGVFSLELVFVLSSCLME